MFVWVGVLLCNQYTHNQWSLLSRERAIRNIASAREWDFTAQMFWWYCARAHIRGAIVHEISGVTGSPHMLGWEHLLPLAKVSYNKRLWLIEEATMLDMLTVGDEICLSYKTLFMKIVRTIAVPWDNTRVALWVLVIGEWWMSWTILNNHRWITLNYTQWITWNNTQGTNGLPCTSPNKKPMQAPSPITNCWRRKHV